jgi:hypothetical protein
MAVLSASNPLEDPSADRCSYPAIAAAPPRSVPHPILEGDRRNHSTLGRSGFCSHQASASKKDQLQSEPEPWETYYGGYGQSIQGGSGNNRQSGGRRIAVHQIARGSIWAKRRHQPYAQAHCLSSPPTPSSLSSAMISHSASADDMVMMVGMCHRWPSHGSKAGRLGIDDDLTHGRCHKKV